MCEDNHSFVPINDSDVNSGIGAGDNKANNYKNEKDDHEADVKNNDDNLDDEDGGVIINDRPIEYDEFNTPITVGNFSMVGRYAVFGFYRQLVRPFKQGNKKLVIICFLCAKALDCTNYGQWTWVKCTRVITNNITSLICNLENNHSGVSSVKALVINKKNKWSEASRSATIHSIRSSPSTCVPSSIAFTMNKLSVELVKRDVFCWIVGYGTPFGKTLLPAFCCIFK